MTSSYKTLLIATHNPGKLNEIKHQLSQLSYKIVGLAELGITYEVPETGTTFEENALLKAKEYARLSGLPTLADDGGLVIDALEGWPGVHSARIAGDKATDQQKVDFILKRMHYETNRAAHFVNVNALIFPDGNYHLFKASIDGIITQEPRGPLIKGLPYRVIFLLPEFNKTMAELDSEGIKYISHRQKALSALITFLQTMPTMQSPAH
jgi:XTP/dITP diphosphohydrolase